MKRSYADSLLTLVVLVATAGILSALLLPAVQYSGRTPSRRSACGNHLRQIAFGLQIYHSDYGSFPPAFTVDPDGKPLHSWRTLFLPYLDQQELYDKIRLDEPWDSEHNRGVAVRIPTYSCPGDFNSLAYLAVTISGGSFENSSRLSEITDGISNTILVIEVEPRPVSWMQPVDFDEAELERIMRDGFPTPHGDGFNVVLANASLQFIEQSLDKEQFKAMLTGGGEPLSVQ